MIYKDKKRNTWYFRVYVEDKYGNKKQKERSGFKTKNDAKNAEIQFVKDANSNSNELLFQELYDIYIGWIKKAIRRFNDNNYECDDIYYYTRERYMNVVISFLEEIAGKKDVAEYFNKYKCILDNLDNPNEKQKIKELQMLMWQMRTRLEEEIREYYNNDADHNYEDWENL